MVKFVFFVAKEIENNCFLELSDKLSNMNENIDQYVAKVKTLEGRLKKAIKICKRKFCKRPTTS